MKANIENLAKCLKICADAHNVVYRDWIKEDWQIGIKGTQIPLVADVKTILNAFYGYADIDVNYDFNCITIYLSDEFLNDVNMTALELALPYNSIKDLK